MDGKHTPGPWRAECDPNLQDKDDLPYFTIEAGKGFYQPGESFSISGIIGDDDAHLIAAAPELYAALEGTRGILADAGATATLADVDATLARARGEG